MAHDIYDLYKAELTIDFAFSMTRELGGQYNRAVVADAFRKRVMASHLLEKIGPDVASLFEKESQSGSGHRRTSPSGSAGKDQMLVH